MSRVERFWSLLALRYSADVEMMKRAQSRDAACQIERTMGWRKRLLGEYAVRRTQRRLGR